MTHTNHHLEQLEYFERHLNQEGFDTALMPAKDEVPYDTLIVILEDEEDEALKSIQLEFSFLPQLEDEIENISLLQIFAQTPIEVKKGSQRDVEKLILKINQTMPLVGFGYIEELNMIYFRHVLMLPDKDDREAGLVLVEQTVWMITYLLHLFISTIDEVASGRQTLEEITKSNTYLKNLSERYTA